MSMDAQRFPCGCVIGTVDDMFVIGSCSPTCELFAYAKEQTCKQGHKFIGEIDLTNVGEFTTYLPRCPYCNAKLDGFSGAQGKYPTLGSVSLCAYCGELLLFGDDNLRKPTKREVRQMRNDSELMAAQKIVRANLRTYPLTNDDNG